MAAAPLVLGLGVAPGTGGLLADEWAWALRGGGAEFRRLTPGELAAPPQELPLLVVDSIPLSEAARRGLGIWVERGGLLVYADAAAALATLGPDRRLHWGRELSAPELFGARFAGFDRGLPGTYPAVVAASALLAPLQPGDALRLGDAGVGHRVRIEATDAEVLAQSARLSPGADRRLVLETKVPTILTRRHGAGRVVFLSFSPGAVAACYPRPAPPMAATDCSGAGSAHALMRWLVANLLWEERHLQLPLIWEAPGDRPHAVIVTGDVHDHADTWEIRAALSMAERLAKLGLPLSLYLYGNLAQKAPAEVAALRAFPDLELGTHSVQGKLYIAQKFGFWGFGAARGILADIRQAETLLQLPHYPQGRGWLRSTRSHVWRSDGSAWEAMRRAGIGLAFDHVADRLDRDHPWQVPSEWFTGGEWRRLFVPLFEHSIATVGGQFRLPEEAQRDLALLASAQPETFNFYWPFRIYLDYVRRWHALFGRLATLGGVTEVWLWHPGGVAGRQAYEGRPGFDELEQLLREFRAEPSVLFLRGDVAATWRANRERYRLRVERDPAGRVRALDLAPPTAPPYPLPPGAPAAAATLSYWVIGPLQVPGWSARQWTDPSGRTITVLTRPLPGVPGP
ncbi:hypothetical protein [Candidatus Methylocalor cossyra]|uniref:hypothetical protein n=1 Tax=Candidatus Methylocalor cossyra TaxID=3108543 RepID=UPI0032B1A62C